MNAIIHNTNRTLEVGAQDIAKTGYHEPHLILGTCGRIHAISPEDGKTVLQTIDMIDRKKELWAEVLAKLAEQGIDTSLPFMQKPFECSVNDSVGIKWDKKGVEVSAWVVQFNGSEAWKAWGPNGALELSLNHLSPWVKDAENCSVILHKNGNNGQSVYQGQDGMYLVNHVNGNSSVYCAYSKKTASEWKAYLADLASKGNPLTVIYQLATPLRLDFHDGSELNLNFSNLPPNALLALDDIDGQRMTQIDVTTRQEADGTYRDTTIHWNADWLAAHPGEFPQTIQTTMAGLGYKIDYPFVVGLLRRIEALEHRINQ